MDPASTISSESRTRFDAWSCAWSWLLGFGLVLYLGLSGGGFDPLVGGQVGIAIWWILLLGVLVGALPRRRPGPAALFVLGLLAAFVLWTSLSLTWTESTEKSLTDVARVASFLGVFGLAVLSRGRDSANQMVRALAAGIAFVAIVAMLSRLHPSWFPDSGETGRFLETGRERLSYPLDYWNGLAALIGIGLPLLFSVAGSGRNIAVRALAATALPAVVLALLFTLSRGGIAAALIGVAVFIAFTRDRLGQLPTLAVTGIGSAILVVLALDRNALMHGYATSTAHSQGSTMLWFTIVVCLIAGALNTAIAFAGERVERPRWTYVSRQSGLYAVGAMIVILVVALVAVNAPHRLSNAWDQFRAPSTSSEHGTSRLTSIGGENRYQYWSSAIREFDSKPLTGTGSGTFQLWWTRDGTTSDPLIDTHSLYLQTLGELGFVGLGLLAALVLGSLAVGVQRTLRAGPKRRPALAAALGGSTVLWTTSVFDWMWKIPVIPIAALLLIAVLVTAGDIEEGGERRGMPLPARAVVVVAAVIALVAIAIPLGSETLLRRSQSEGGAGDNAAALTDARSAQNIEPEAASPRLQQALILESEGEFAPAAAAAQAATERESTNWRTWLVLSRIEAQRGRVDAALRAYRKARGLNPLAEVFQPQR